MLSLVQLTLLSPVLWGTRGQHGRDTGASSLATPYQRAAGHIKRCEKRDQTAAPHCRDVWASPFQTAELRENTVC